MKTLLQTLFLLFLITTTCVKIIPAVHSRCIQDQQLSLLHLKQSLKFSEYAIGFTGEFISWNSSTDCCSWDGVTCSSNGRVVGLDLSSQYISGPLPGSFANFSNLRVLSLAYNNISGPLPGFFANFSKLTSLSLSDCGLKGTFPKEIFQVPSLQTIDLSFNDELHGSFPEFPKNGSLQSLDLSMTKFSGLLPESIGNLKMLSIVSLYGGCSFTGFIPKSIENLTQLVHLDMSSNRFSGPINSIHWQNLVNLQYLRLDSNLLSGSIPSSIFSHPLLVELILSQNQFSGQLHEFANVSSNLINLDLSFNNFEGPIPVSLFNFRGLQHLSLSSNNFSAFPFNGPQQLLNLRSIDLSNNSLLICYNGTNSSYSSFPHIESLNLASNKLRTIPDFLRNNQSTTLGILDLSVNQIQGEVPNWIWRLSSLSELNLSCNSLVTLEAPLLNSSLLYVDLHSNQLHGEIFYFLPNSYYLDYSKNNFSSHIPIDIGDFLSDIRFLSLSSNNLLGIIPVSLCNASFEVLDLSNNFLPGMIPKCLTAKTTLGVLNLGRNNLSGPIPNSDQYCGLRVLDLGRNKIEGQLPKYLAKCSQLEVFNLKNNQIIDTFPCWLMNNYFLRVLSLRFNKFYGGIRCSKTHGTWPNLQIIDLAHNKFSGEIPRNFLGTWDAMITNEDALLPTVNVQGRSSSHRQRVDYSFEDGIAITSKGSERDLVKILTIFTLIDFSCNNFNGSIPKVMGKFKSLYILNLSSNAFTGEIPSSFGNMRQLESLDLSQNKLSGEIPAQLAKLTFLSFLNLSNNQLVGRIPTSTQFSTFPKDCFTGNKGLWGPLLTVDNKSALSPPPTLNGSLPNSGLKIDWDLISVEIGFTFGFGVAIGSLVLCKRWNRWYYKAMYNILLKIFPQLEERIGIHRRHVHINPKWGRG